MATTTPNFGWSVPTSSDLVKNGATAIETLGDSIDASMAELKGGTTGQVLAKTSATDMDFTWTTPSAGSSGSSNVAGKNGVLNSNFSIWQRGTSVALTTSAYTADRWQGYRSVAGSTASRQVTNDTTNLPFIQYCARVQRDLANTSTSKIYIGQSFETVNSIGYAGKTVTLSFYARAGANYSSASSGLDIALRTGTGTDQNMTVAGYTGSANIVSTTQAITTTWTRYTFSGTAATTATEIGVEFSFTPVGTALANDYFEVTGVQLEIAASVSAYSPNASTQALELAACQRYFANVYPSTANYGTVIAMFQADSSTTAKGGVRFPVTMRTSASITLASANNFTLATANYTPVSGSSFTYAIGNTVDCRIDMSVASGLVAGNASALSGNTANLLIQASAEL